MELLPQSSCNQCKYLIKYLHASRLFKSNWILCEYSSFYPDNFPLHLLALHFNDKEELSLANTVSNFNETNHLNWHFKNKTNLVLAKKEQITLKITYCTGSVHIWDSDLKIQMANLELIYVPRANAYHMYVYIKRQNPHTLLCCLSAYFAYFAGWEKNQVFCIVHTRVPRVTTLHIHKNTLPSFCISKPCILL